MATIDSPSAMMMIMPCRSAKWAGASHDTRQPGIPEPRPPRDAEHQHPLSETGPGRVMGHQRRALGDREDEDEVEEELQRLDLLALPEHRPDPWHARRSRRGGHRS